MCTLHWYILTAQERIIAEFALAFPGVHQLANGRWLTVQSESALYFCYILLIYTLNDLGDSSSLVGSLSRTMTLFLPR